MNRQIALAITAGLALAAGAASLASTTGDKPKPTTMTMEVRAYCPCRLCCGKWADVPMARRTIGGGAPLYPLIRDGVGFVAGPPSLPRGSWVSVPGYHDGQPVQVLDRGGAVKGNRLEVFIPCHEAAQVWGVQELGITIYPGDQRPKVATQPGRAGLRHGNTGTSGPHRGGYPTAGLKTPNSRAKMGAENVNIPSLNNYRRKG